MKNICIAVLALVGLTVPSRAWAADKSAEALAKEKNCMACHGISDKLVGPSFKDVAAKYAGQPDAPDKLVYRTLNGSTGVWGAVAMPPQSQVTQQQAKTLIKWILTLK